MTVRRKGVAVTGRNIPRTERCCLNDGWSRVSYVPHKFRFFKGKGCGIVAQGQRGTTLKKSNSPCQWCWHRRASTFWVRRTGGQCWTFCAKNKTIFSSRLHGDLRLEQCGEIEGNHVELRGEVRSDKMSQKHLMGWVCLSREERGSDLLVNLNSFGARPGSFFWCRVLDRQTRTDSGLRPQTQDAQKNQQNPEGSPLSNLLVRTAIHNMWGRIFAWFTKTAVSAQDHWWCRCRGYDAVDNIHLHRKYAKQ